MAGPGGRAKTKFAIAMRRASLGPLREIHTRDLQIGSKIIFAPQQRFHLGSRALLKADLSSLEQREISMVRELQLLTVGLVFAFLGAIVMGIF